MIVQIEALQQAKQIYSYARNRYQWLAASWVREGVCIANKGQ